MQQGESILPVCKGYEILEKLGRGGFSTVYLAKQESSGQRVAVKVLREDPLQNPGESARRRERFLREAELCRELRHPHIVLLLDCGEAELENKRLPFAVFEYVPGQTLAQYLNERGSLSAGETGLLMGQVLDALVSVHAHGIVHRDLKPSNLMIFYPDRVEEGDFLDLAHRPKTSERGRPHLKILDFGIGALLPQARGHDYESLTLSRETLGTPSYSSPEQLRGEPPTTKSDLYAWGLLVQECLTGRPVMHGATAAAIVHQQLSPLEVPIVGAIATHPLGELLRGVLDKNAKDRMGDASQVYEAFRKLRFEELVGHFSGGAKSDTPHPGAPPRKRSLYSLRPSMFSKPNAVELSSKNKRSGTSSADFKKGSNYSLDLEGLNTSALRQSSPASWVEDSDDSQGHVRQITVLAVYLDVEPVDVDSKNLERLSADTRNPIQQRVESLQREILIKARDLIGRYGGTVAGTLGSVLLGYFGYPQLGDDDARRAARAVLEINEWQQRKQASFPKFRIVCRAALHTGIVHIEKGEAPTGMTPNRAIDLVRVVPSGEIWLSEATRKMVINFLEVESLEDGNFRLLGERSSGSLTVRSVKEGSVFLGRQAEIQRLETVWRECLGGFGQSLLIVGEAGIGKSSLLKAFRRKLELEEHHAAEMRCLSEHRNHALYPVLEALRRHLGLRELPSLEAQAKRVVEVAKELDFPSQHAVPLFCVWLALPLPDGYELLQHAPQKQKQMFLSLLVEFWRWRSIRNQSSRKDGEQESSLLPRLFVVEDLHWVDPTTLEFLELLRSQTLESQTFLLMTARPELTELWEKQTGELARLEIGSLEETAQRELIKTLLTQASRKEEKSAGVEREARTTEVDEEAMQYILRQADGVPLYLEALTFDLVERDLLIEREEKFRLSGDFARADVPLTLRDVLSSRIDRLGIGLETAQWAAALGREFEHDVLAACLGRKEGSIQADLDQMVDAGLLVRRRRISKPTYFFRHALIRDVAYESILPRHRSSMHGRIAQALSHRFPDLVQREPARIAQHYAEAEIFNRAVEYGTMAAEKSIATFANDETLRNVASALDWLAKMSNDEMTRPKEIKLLNIRMLAYMNIGSWADARNEPTACRLLELLEDASVLPPVLLFEVGSTLMTYTLNQAKWDTHRLVREKVGVVAETVDNPSLRLLASYEKACTHWIRCEMGEAKQLLERVVGDYRAERDLPYARSTGLDLLEGGWVVLGMSEIMRGEASAGLKSMANGVSAARELGNPMTLCHALFFQISAYLYLGKRQECAEGCLELSETAENYGLQMFQGLGVFPMIWSSDLPVELGIGTLEMLLASGQRFSIPYMYLVLAETCFDRKDVDQALELATKGLDFAESTDEICFQPELHRLKARYLFELGTDRSKAIKHSERAIEWGCELALQPTEFRALGELARREGLSDERLRRLLELHQENSELIQHLGDESLAAYLREALQAQV